ncbi:MAG: hypothetical protein LBO80_03355 [Treponema sp.]|nr:hypothetical protein [Treponema sp.]
MPYQHGGGAVNGVHRRKKLLLKCKTKKRKNNNDNQIHDKIDPRIENEEKLGTDQEYHKADGIMGAVIQNPNVNTEDHKHYKKAQKAGVYNNPSLYILYIKPAGKEKKAEFHRSGGKIDQHFLQVFL